MLVFDDLIKIMEKNKMCAIIATHNNELANKMHKKYFISAGNIAQIS
jgi:ABC-type lipoprotein export system ATPase subunit